MAISNYLTAFEVVDEASSMVGLGDIDSSFGLFDTTDNSSSKYYRNLLNRACRYVLQSYFDHLDDQFQAISKLTLAIELNNSLFKYVTTQIPIDRIIKVLFKTQILYRKSSLLNLDNKSYVLQPESIITSTKFSELTLYYLDDRIFITKPEDNIINEISRKNTLENNGDIILLDRELLVYKMCELIAETKLIPNLPQVYKNLYQIRLIYLKERNVDLKAPIYL